MLGVKCHRGDLSFIISYIACDLLHGEDQLPNELRYDMQEANRLYKADLMGTGY